MCCASLGLTFLPVCVSTYHVQPIAGLILSSYRKGYDSRQVSGEVVSSTWLQFPFLLF